MLKSRGRTDESFRNGKTRNGLKSVEINRHYSIYNKDSSKTKRVTSKGGDALCQRKAKTYVLRYFATIEMPSQFQMNVSSVLFEGQLNDGFMK